MNITVTSVHRVWGCCSLTCRWAVILFIWSGMGTGDFPFPGTQLLSNLCLHFLACTQKMGLLLKDTSQYLLVEL